MNSINLIFLLAMSTWATCTKISLPYDFTTVSSGTRATLQANFSEGATKSNNCFDSTDEVRGRMTGYSGDFTITSLDNLKLRLDVDGSLSGRFMVLNGATGDSLLRVQEDSTWKVWGPGEGTKLTLSDSILAATARISGLTASRLMATNAGSTLASVSDLTSWIAGTTNQITSTSDGDGSITLSIPNGFTLPSASPTFTGLTLSGNATVGGTLGVTGVSTFTAQPILSSLTASLPVFTNGSKGLVSNAMTGTGNVMMSASPTTTGTLTAAAANFSGAVTMASTFAQTSNSSNAWTSTINGNSGGWTYKADHFATLHLYSDADNNSAASDASLRFYTNLASYRGEIGYYDADSSMRITSGGSAGFSGANGGLIVANNGTVSTTGKFTSPDTVVATYGVRFGSDANIYRSATNMLTTPDSLTVSGKLFATNAPRFSSVTASQILSVDANKDLTSTATTGSGSVVLATSPTVSGLTLSGTTATGLTASRTLITDGSGNMAVNTETGTGSHVRATSPTIASPTYSGTLTTPLTASLPVFTNGSSQLTTNAMTGTGNVMMSASPTTTGTLTAAAANFSAKVVSSDTVAASLGFRAGSAGATDVSLYRSGSNMWTTPDSLTVGGNLTADSIIAPKFYQDTTFTLTAYTGMTTTPTGTAYATRIGRVVTLMIPYITGTSNGVAFFLSGIPTGWRPAQEQAFPISVYVDNSSTQYGAGSALVLASGIIVLQSGALTWTSSGTKAIGSSDYTNTITYMLQ